MERMIVGEKQVVEQLPALLNTSEMQETVRGYIWISNFRIIFEFENGCFEESIENIGVMGTSKVESRTRLMIQFINGEQAIFWYLFMENDDIANSVYATITKVLDEVED